MAANETESRIQTVCLLILAGLAMTAAMYFFRAAMIPFVLAVFFTYCLAPVIEFQIHTLRMPRVLAVVSTIALGCGILVAAGAIITTAVNDVSANLEVYTQQANSIVEWVRERVPAERLGLEEGEAIFHMPSETLTGLVSSIVAAVMNIVSNGLVVMIFMIFMIAGRWKSGVAATGVMADIEDRAKRYLIAMLVTSALTGFLTGLTFQLLGVPFAWMFGMLAFLLNFIPNIGSVIATLLPIPVVILNPELSVPVKVLSIVIPTIIQFAIGNLLQPKMMGESLDLHPVTILLALILFGIIWGIPGMFLATPIAAVVRILLDRVTYTAPVAEVMAGRLPRTE